MPQGMGLGMEGMPWGQAPFSGTFPTLGGFNWGRSLPAPTQVRPNPVAQPQASQPVKADVGGIQQALQRVQGEAKIASAQGVGTVAGGGRLASAGRGTIGPRRRPAGAASRSLPADSRINKPTLPGASRTKWASARVRAGLRLAGPLTTPLAYLGHTPRADKLRFVAKEASQDNSAPQRSATGESSGLKFNENKDDYSTGQEAWAATSRYFHGGSKLKKEPNPFEGKHRGEEKNANALAGKEASDMHKNAEVPSKSATPTETRGQRATRFAREGARHARTPIEAKYEAAVSRGDNAMAQYYRSKMQGADSYMASLRGEADQAAARLGKTQRPSLGGFREIDLDKAPATAGSRQRPAAQPASQPAPQPQEPARRKIPARLASFSPPAATQPQAQQAAPEGPLPNFPQPQAGVAGKSMLAQTPVPDAFGQPARPQAPARSSPAGPNMPGETADMGPGYRPQPPAPRPMPPATQPAAMPEPPATRAASMKGPGPYNIWQQFRNRWGQMMSGAEANRASQMFGGDVPDMGLKPVQPPAPKPKPQFPTYAPNQMFRTRWGHNISGTDANRFSRQFGGDVPDMGLKPLPAAGGLSKGGSDEMTPFAKAFFDRLVKEGVDAGHYKAAVDQACERFGEDLREELEDGLQKQAGLRSQIFKGGLGAARGAFDWLVNKGAQKGTQMATKAVTRDLTGQMGRRAVRGLSKATPAMTASIPGRAAAAVSHMGRGQVAGQAMRQFGHQMATPGRWVNAQAAKRLGQGALGRAGTGAVAGAFADPTDDGISLRGAAIGAGLGLAGSRGGRMFGGAGKFRQGIHNMVYRPLVRAGAGGFAGEVVDQTGLMEAMGSPVSARQMGIGLGAGMGTPWGRKAIVGLTKRFGPKANIPKAMENFTRGGFYGMTRPITAVPGAIRRGAQQIFTGKHSPWTGAGSWTQRMLGQGANQTMAGRIGTAVGAGGAALGIAGGAKGLYENEKQKAFAEGVQAYGPAAMETIKQQMPAMADEYLKSKGIDINQVAAMSKTAGGFSQILNIADPIFSMLGLDPAGMSPMSKGMILLGALGLLGGSLGGSGTIAGLGGLAMMGGLMGGFGGKAQAAAQQPGQAPPDAAQLSQLAQQNPEQFSNWAQNLAAEGMAPGGNPTDPAYYSMMRDATQAGQASLDNMLKQQRADNTHEATQEAAAM